MTTIFSMVRRVLLFPPSKDTYSTQYEVTARSILGRLDVTQRRRHEPSSCQLPAGRSASFSSLPVEWPLIWVRTNHTCRPFESYTSARLLAATNLPMNGVLYYPVHIPLHRQQDGSLSAIQALNHATTCFRSDLHSQTWKQHQGTSLNRTKF